MNDSFNILSRCAQQLLRINRAQASIAYTVFDSVSSFSCDASTHVEHTSEALSQAFIDEITILKKQITQAEFNTHSDIIIYPGEDNPFGLTITGQQIKNLRIIPISDPLTVYAVVVVVNAMGDRLSADRINVRPFVTATANLFSIKQIKTFLPKKVEKYEDHNNRQGVVNSLLSHVYHPVIFFSQNMAINKFNKHGMLLVQQSNMTDDTNMRSLLSYFVPTIATNLLSQVENYSFVGKLVKSEWTDIPLKLNSFQSIIVDLKIIIIEHAQTKGRVNNTDSVQFALLINDNKRNELHSLQRFQALTSLIPLGILQLTKDFKCLYANDTWSNISSLNMTTSLQDGWAKCFESRDLHRVLPAMERLNMQNREHVEELKLMSSMNNPKWVSLKSVALFDQLGNLDGFIVTVDDVSHIHEQKEALKNLANTDSLTGISNRNCFHDRLKVAISRVDRHDNAAVLFIDLDKFKVINDTYGHNAGDAVIQKTAQRLHDVVRAEDTIARLGGDEFAIIVSDQRNKSDVINLAIKIITEIAKPMHFQKNVLKVQCSIGIANITHSRTTIKTVLKQADLAVYKAKSLGRNQYCVYTESLERETLLANYLRSSLRGKECNGFFMEYQPHVDSSTNKIVGVEALSRWRHPKDIDVSPQEFILQLETHGLINDFFVWQLESLLPIAKRWIDDGLLLPERRLSINLSAVQLHLPNFARQLLDTMTKHNVDCHCLGLEVTETAFMQDPISAGENLRLLRAAGLAIALDDFGTGFSSLSLLRKMPLDSVKIDKEFIADILTNATDAKIVQSMITLSRELDLSVVAEGVETPEVKQWLDDNKCPLQQGFHFYRPMAHAQLESCLLKESALH
jgi:diguanylate cyclase (GGDEF)-like protein